MNSKHAFLALSVFTLVSIAHGEREVFAPTTLAPVATAANGNITFSNVAPFWTGANISATTNFGIGPTTASVLSFHTNGAERMRINSAGAIYLGNGEQNATPISSELRATNGTGTNINGANLSIYGGVSTGSGSGGVVAFFTSPAGGSGTSLNSTRERMRIDSAGDIIAGNGDTSATPAASTIRGTNASGTDISGSNLTIQASRGTGSASGGSILLQTAPTGTTGSTLNAAVTRMVVHTNGTVFVGPSSVSATPTTGNISSAGGLGTNIAGSGLDIRAGAGTGTGAGGSINLYTASPGGVSGSGLNSQTARVTLKPGGQLRFVPLAADPTLNVEDGDVYYNSATNKLRVRAAGVWVDLH